MRILTYLLMMLTIPVLSQIDETEIIDLTDVLFDKSRGWAIGNACGIPYRINAIYNGDLDMNDGVLEILNTHLKVEGDIINVATIEYLCDNAIIEVNATLGIPENIIVKPKVYPNPFQNAINITGIEVGLLEVFDLSGRRLKYYKTTGRNHRILLDNLSSSMYILRVNNQHNFKIIKQ